MDAGQYVMSVEVPFPGMGNDVKVSMPITLDSGIDRAVAQKGGGAAPQARMERAAARPSESLGGGGDVAVPRVEEPPSALP